MKSRFENSHVFALILAGGKSSRMGQDKANLNILDGMSVVSRQFNHLSKLVGSQDRVFVSGKFPEYPFIVDRNQNYGPIEGVCSFVESVQKSEYLLLVHPVDLYGFNSTHFHEFLNGIKAVDLVAYEGNYIPCLIRINSSVREILFSIRNAIHSNERSFRSLHQLIQSCQISSDPGFFDFNTPEAWSFVQKKFLKELYENSNI